MTKMITKEQLTIEDILFNKLKLNKDHYKIEYPAKKNSPYDATITNLQTNKISHIELKCRNIPSTKYSDIVVDDVKMNQLLKLENQTILLTTFTDNKVYIGNIVEYTEVGVKLNPKVKSFTKKARKTTDFSVRQWVDKVFYSLDLTDCKEVIV